MKRIAIIGNSHIKAFKDARAAIQTQFPDVELQFFGLPNPVFFKSDKRNGAALRLDHPVDTGGDQMITEQGQHLLDLTDFDTVLLTSHGFFYKHFAADFAGLDLLGHPQADPARTLISLPCAHDIIRDRIEQYTRRLRQFFPPAHNLVVIQSPYPTDEAANIDAALGKLLAHPARDTLFESYQTLLNEACLADGLALFMPPAELLACSFFTQPDFARQRSLDDPAKAEFADYIHMNDRYAARVFAQLYADIA